MVRFAARFGTAVLLALVLLPTEVFAQASLTGTVKDSSGGVLPGVTAEAASPVLIEKVRAVVTDETGQFRIVNLPPGTYSVTFSLPGFSSVRRDGIELSGSFVATVNGEMKVGALEETITVTGETPIVDVQSVKVQQVVTAAVLNAIPTSRTAAGMQTLIAGIVGTNQDVGGASGTSGGNAGSIHGGRENDSRTLNDGLTTNHAGGSGGGGNDANVGGAQEVVISTSGGLGEAEVSGVTINLIPREGSNMFSGTVFANGANGAMQGSNYTQSLKDQGLRTPSELLKVYDINPMAGGRIVRDRLWFYATFRQWGADNTVAGMWFNKNAGNPNRWTYEPDLDRPAFSDALNRTSITRLTWQATPRNKFSMYWSENYNSNNVRGGGSATEAPEATNWLVFEPSRIQQFIYSSPITNRFLAEAGFGAWTARYGNGWGVGPTDDRYNEQMIRVNEQSGSIPGLNFRLPVEFQRHKVRTKTWRASLSYVTGAHNMKFGYFGGFTNPSQAYYYYNQLITYRFSNGQPNRLTETGVYPNVVDYTRNQVPTSLYAQDQWTSGRLTLQGGIRYDYMLTTYPEQRVGGTPIIPNEIVYPSRSTRGLNWSDVTPRMGASYDLFGTGKTAVKVNLGKYMETVRVTLSDLDLNPLIRTAVSTTRAWTDSNKDFVPNCDLTNPNKNGECGDMANKNLGKDVYSRTFDPAFTEGWGNRPYNWGLGVSVQQALGPRVSVNVGYFRNWWGNWYVVDNRANSLSDYTAFSIIAPVDERLPGGGGQTISGLYNLNQNKVGLIDEFAAHATNYGKQTENWHGVDVTLNARVRNGITVQAGMSTGRRLADSCEVRATMPELGMGLSSEATGVFQNSSITAVGPTAPYCHVVEPFLTRLTGLAHITIPKADVQLSGTWQSNPGPELAANYVMSNALVKPFLGRDLSGGAANITVNLVQPGTLYGDRINQVDFRLSKILRYGRTRTNIGIDIYNAFNTDVPRTYNQTFVPGGAWLTPTAVLTARFMKVGVAFDF